MGTLRQVDTYFKTNASGLQNIHEYYKIKPTQRTRIRFYT